MQILMAVLLILIGVLLFGFVIFFHELGHFIFAKLAGIRVHEFSIGMGPKLLGKQKGDTLYSLRLLPIGGYCAMEGEDEESSDPAAFGSKPVWRRILVVAAGGVFNVVLGFLLMGITLAPQEVFATTQVSKFTEGSALEAAGAQPGDKIVSIDGYAIYNDRDMSFAMAMANPDSVAITVERAGQRISLGPFSMDYQEVQGRRVVSPEFYVQPEPRTAWGVVKRSFTYTFSMTRMVIESLKGIVSGRFGLNEIAGPVGTVQAISVAAEAGMSESFGKAVGNILQMIIMITVNLGVVNLLPLPALDGGRLLFLIWEGITRRPVPAKYEGYVHAAGFALLICLMVVITFNDIVRIFTG